MRPGYCTNIHPGTSLPEVIANLDRFATRVREAVCPSETMGIGLWLPCDAVHSALDGDNWRELAGVLDRHRLIAVTFNAFPFGDFHQEIVKHRVYQPTWAEPSRLEYTLQVAELMARLLPEGSQGSISTLPVGWPARGGVPGGNEALLLESAANLARSARGLAALRERTGRHIRLAIEPEPGCLLQSSQDLCEFFDQYLDAQPESPLIREFTGVCHDVCHAAVMFEDQRAALDRYAAAGVSLCKVQISSAVETRLAADDQGDESGALGELAAFAEKKYLHQTAVRQADGSTRFFEDLPPALQYLGSLNESAVARTHFHVPIHLPAIGALHTTQAAIDECLAWMVEKSASGSLSPDVEVETYAWSVSPEAARGGSLVDSIVAELNWLHRHGSGFKANSPHRR